LSDYCASESSIAMAGLAADAELRHTSFEIAALQGMQEPHDQPRAGSPDRVTQSTRATMDVWLVGGISGSELSQLIRGWDGATATIGKDEHTTIIMAGRLRTDR
jgi:hypothetical protein